MPFVHLCDNAMCAFMRSCHVCIYAIMSFVHCFDNAISSVYGSTVVTRRYLCHWLLGAECFFEPKQEPIVSLKNGNAVFYFFFILPRMCVVVRADENGHCGFSYFVERFLRRCQIPCAGDQRYCFLLLRSPVGVVWCRLNEVLVALID